jgi:hypothetical protein
MSKPFDSMLNSLIDDHLQDWGHYLAKRFQLPTGPVKAVDTDLSKNLQADRLFIIEADPAYAIHLEMESSSRLGIPKELLRYNVLASDIVGKDVYSVIMLLRPRANASDLTGRYSRGKSGHFGYLGFEYGVVRVWEEPFDSFLQIKGLSPLSVLTDEAYRNEKVAFDKLFQMLKSNEVSSGLTQSLLSSTFVLSGLRYSAEKLALLFEDLVMTLEDSATYQAILRKGRSLGERQGRLVEAREMLLELAADRLGEPDTETKKRIEEIEDHELLKRMIRAALSANQWPEIFEVT